MEKITTSRYTFFVKFNDKFYLYNSLSNALIEVDEELYILLENLKNKHIYYTPSTETESLFFDLKKDCFVTYNVDDDFLIYKSIIHSLRSQNSSMHLTLVPTMDCCFSCSYCFEKKKNKIHMSESVMDSIISFLSQQKQVKYLRLTWFGGEPLMAIDEIDLFFSKLKPLLDNFSFSSNIITTGYHLDERAISVLKKAKVTSAQITLDGNKDSHNQVKFLKDCDDVFSKVLDNIQLAATLYPELEIVVRVNLTKDNANEYSELQRYILNRFLGKKVSVAPAIVLDRNGCTASNNLFSTSEYSNYILNLSYNDIDSPQIRYPKNTMRECAIRNKNAVSFDAEGNFYKCWEHVGNPEFVVGKLNESGQINLTNVTLFNRQMFGADQLEDNRCRECSYLPLCNGGCPIQRVENKFNNGKNVNCIFYKGVLDKYIIEHIKRKMNV